jgi:site-specific DNA-methyltransferase (adenine-specific)
MRLIQGDCKDVLAAMDEGSVGSVVCDPPYGLRFMGKDFDCLGDGEAQRLWHAAWLRPAFRALRPGGTLQAFGGTRTFHHLAAAMEEVGFVGLRLEAWTYGSGFPKSRDVGRQIDAAAGAEREVVGYRISAFGDPELSETGDGRNVWCKPSTKVVPLTGSPVTDAARAWEGWGTALKPAWEVVVVGVKP